MTEHQRKEIPDFDRLVAELAQEIAKQQQELYSKVIIQEARHPSNLGRIVEANAHGLVHGWCGDTMEIYVKLDDEKIEQATFMTDGCGVTVACGSMLTKVLTGKLLDEAIEIMPDDLIKALDGLPEGHQHCAELAVSTFQNALGNLKFENPAQAESLD
ncbi:MAG: iron-sulfur cluster assembly scaffold protein [Chloroflexi bacterium]|nr:iron-sulfur cluster assembly scaffold protein [Chloroflexota bacterium]